MRSVATAIMAKSSLSSKINLMNIKEHQRILESVGTYPISGMPKAYTCNPKTMFSLTFKPNSRHRLLASRILYSVHTSSNPIILITMSIFIRNHLCRSVRYTRGLILDVVSYKTMQDVNRNRSPTSLALSN